LVRSRRGRLGAAARSRAEAHDLPGCTRGRTGPAETVVQAVEPVRPELDLLRHDPVAAPERRTLGIRALLGRDPLHLADQRAAALERLRLARGPGAETARQRAAAEVFVGLRPVLARDGAAGPDLAAQALPVHDEGRLAGGLDLPCLH